MLKLLWQDVITWCWTFRSKLKDYHKRFPMHSLTLSRKTEAALYSEVHMPLVWLVGLWPIRIPRTYRLKFLQLKKTITSKGNESWGSRHNYLISRRVSTFNDHLMFPLVGSTRWMFLPRLIEMLPEVFLYVDSKAMILHTISENIIILNHKRLKGDSKKSITDHVRLPFGHT